MKNFQSFFVLPLFFFKSYRSRTAVSRSLSINSRRGAVKPTSAADSMMSDILEMAQVVAEQLDSQVFEAKIHRGVGVAMAPAHAFHGAGPLEHVVDGAARADVQPQVEAQVSLGVQVDAQHPRAPLGIF